MEKYSDAQKLRERTIVNQSIVHFGERLKEAMTGMSYVELARKSGLSESTIRKYVQGKMYPGIDSVAMVAQACNVSMMWLITGQKDDQYNNTNNVDYSAPPVTSHANAMEHMTDVVRDWLRVFERLSDEDKTKVTDFIAMNGIRCLLLMCDAGSLDLLTLEPFKREVALLFKQMTVDEVREILRQIRRIEDARSQGHYGGGSLSSGVA
ncbi:helix-turn-helix transcriptional regulator [Salmonella enterica]|nr:helix-turn-helix transcriptional regulator [Salmonella enterica]EDX6116550.1 helix-turn-helix transcriptional regulator [Salmonella enterica subsp. enterica]EGL6578999.1 helix-turn-helix transcriptional regulator [Salmonella enterica]EHT8643086.1 helix-turn-helix transcriptional regulator [Salmonella enterica]EIF0355894.1 helix-turn-helix transcriptional regulator [Salmonella enterica]